MITKTNAIKTYDNAFELYKRTTQEKQNIAYIIKTYVDIKPEYKVLDIGSAQGMVVKMVQPNLENITMVDIIEQDVSPCKYIKKPFEEIDVVTIRDKYDVVIASHVWGHFYYNNSANESLIKMCDATKNDGYLVIVSNTNAGFFGELGKYVKKLLPKSQINQFHEFRKNSEEYCFIHFAGYVRSLWNCGCYHFNTNVRMENMDQLTDLCRIFFVNDDKEYTNKRDVIHHYLKTHLAFPELCIEQKALIVQVKK
jgi:2-polyprenyl-3-methyl-5-hydroxy-6-metoxy-1,4-benzoquinol methylase